MTKMKKLALQKLLSKYKKDFKIKFHKPIHIIKFGLIKVLGYAEFAFIYFGALFVIFQLSNLYIISVNPASAGNITTPDMSYSAILFICFYFYTLFATPIFKGFSLSKRLYKTILIQTILNGDLVPFYTDAGNKLNFENELTGKLEFSISTSPQAFDFLLLIKATTSGQFLIEFISTWQYNELVIKYVPGSSELIPEHRISAGLKTHIQELRDLHSRGQNLNDYETERTRIDTVYNEVLKEHSSQQKA